MPAHARPGLTRDVIEPMVTQGLCVTEIARRLSKPGHPVHDSLILRRLRKWGLAASKGRHDYTAGDRALIESLCDGNRRLRDVSRLFREATGRVTTVAALKRRARLWHLRTRPCGGTERRGVRGLGPPGAGCAPMAFELDAAATISARASVQFWEAA